MKKEAFLDAMELYTVALFTITDDRYVQWGDVLPATITVSNIEPQRSTSVWLKPINETIQAVEITAKAVIKSETNPGESGVWLRPIRTEG